MSGACSLARCCSLLTVARIPFERALDFANKEKITELLYPLFVHNIGALLYHPTNQSRTNAVMAAAERRKQDQSQMRHAQQPSLPSMQHQQPPHHLARPALDRPHAFPTPPTSASSVLGAMNNQDAALPWGSSNMASAASNMPMDGNLAHPRSMPTTPATTPPGSAMQSMPNYPSNGATYDHTRTHMYSAAPAPPSAYAPAPPTARYPPAASYVKNEMAPPLRGPHDPEATEYKDAHGYASNGHAAPHDADHAHDSEYAHDAAPNYDAGRGSYAYTNGNSVATEHPHLSPDMGSPTQSASGRATPRTSTHSAGYYGHQTGYTTPPRNQPASSNLYNVISHERGATNGSMNGDTYTSATDLNGGLSNGYVHAAPGSNKRSRDDDDDDQERPSSRGPTGEMEGGLKRRRTIREGSASGPVYETSLNRSRTVVGPRHR